MQVLKTRYLSVNNHDPEPEFIAEGAEVIAKGGLVAFPTETVYGLGADGLNPDAVLQIFRVKGRPQENPLILHVSSLDQARELVSCWPPVAELLADKFLPGPLTLILPCSKRVPEQVTAGLATVALRYPSNRVALALIEASGVPIAAPSANISGRPSPTCAQHVLTDLDGKIDMILDGGPVQVGVESTILSLAEALPTLLRPGGVTREEIEQVLGEKIVVPEYVLHPEELSSEAGVPSPGIYFKHYSPQAEVVMVIGSAAEQVAKVQSYLACHKNRRVAVLATSEHYAIYQNSDIQPVYLASLGSRLNPDEIAHHLFKAFREGDAAGAEVMLVEAISPTGMGLAVMNRLCRAAGQHQI